MVLGDLLTKNFGWKLASGGVACAIWFSIHQSLHDTEQGSAIAGGALRTFQLPITVMTAASDPRGFRVQPDKVQVTVRGSREMLRDLGESDVQVFVNLVGVQEVRGLRKRLLVNTPHGVALMRVMPEEVSIEQTPLLDLRP